MKILVSDNLAAKGVELLRDHGLQVDVRERTTPEELAEIIGEYDALIIRSATKVTRQIIEAAGHLKAIGRAGVGVDNVDVEAATGRGIVVMNTPGGNTTTAAEHTCALLLALAKNIPQATASLKGGRWEKGRFVSVEVAGKVLGVIGLGRIGVEVAKRARGFQMQVVAYDPFISEEAAAALGVELTDLPVLFQRSDFITIHTPLTPETQNLISRETIAQMKEGVRIINCARGGIVDEEALVEALKSGRVAGAALDVFEREPVTESPLFFLPNFICTPHLGAASEEAQENVAVEIAEQIAAYLTKGIIWNAVNAPSIAPELLRQIHPYLTLAEKLGRLGSQLSEGRMREVRLHFQGEVATLTTAPLTAAAVMGVLAPILPDSVNFVNALALAKGRSIRVVESKSSQESDFATLITVTLSTDKGTSEVAGTLFNRQEPRLVRINEFRLEAVPEGYLLIFSNLDVPGVIGRIGTLLGKNTVNIAGMQLGRERPGGRAVSVLNVDGPIPSPVLDEIRRMPDIVSAKLVKV